MAATQGAVVVQLRTAQKKRPANRQRFDPDAVHKRILHQAMTLAWRSGRPDPDQYPDLANLLSSALADARSRRNRRRSMVHWYLSKNYRMSVEGFDRLCLYDIGTGRKLVSSACFAL